MKNKINIYTQRWNLNRKFGKKYMKLFRRYVVFWSVPTLCCVLKCSDGMLCFEVFRRYVVLWSVPTVCCVFHFITNYYYVSSRVCDNGLRQWLVWCYCSGVIEAVLSLKKINKKKSEVRKRKRVERVMIPQVA
jgi:hypothetical protein